MISPSINNKDEDKLKLFMGRIPKYPVIHQPQYWIKSLTKF